MYLTKDEQKKIRKR